jgi:ABC-type multidrug transport system fused ATPase/permease subunit
VHASLSGVSDGRVIATVTYDELVQRGGFFAELVQAQFGAVT